jgi:DNA ligase-1
MADLNDGESVEMKGSGAKPYILKKVGGVYSCSCPAWRNQSVATEQRSCKDLRKLRGDAAEQARTGQVLSPKSDPEAEDGAAAGDDKAGPPLLLAERWDNAQHLAGWWLSEKLDGVRAYWDGTSLISRLGHAIQGKSSQGTSRIKRCRTGEWLVSTSRPLRRTPLPCRCRECRQSLQSLAWRARQR